MKRACYKIYKDDITILERNRYSQALSGYLIIPRIKPYRDEYHYEGLIVTFGNTNYVVPDKKEDMEFEKFVKEIKIPCRCDKISPLCKKKCSLKNYDSEYGKNEGGRR